MQKIAIYPGSFNPFHRGHYDILLKAEKIFDKVVIARGVNVEKKNEILPMPSFLGDRTVMTYSGLTTDFIKGLPFDNITIIRGLRNVNDFQYELDQYRYLQDLMPNIQMVSVFCDSEFSHISSSGIRNLSGYGSELTQKYLLD